VHTPIILSYEYNATHSIMKKIKKKYNFVLITEETGQAMVEYTIIVACVFAEIFLLSKIIVPEIVKYQDLISRLISFPFP